MPLFLFGINKIAVSMSNVSKIGTPYLIKSKSINDDYQMREIRKFFPQKKMGVRDGLVKWRCRTAWSNGVVKPRGQTGLSNGVVQRHCKMAL